MSDITKEHILKFLQNVPGFAEIPDDVLAQISNLFVHNHLQPGEFLIRQGEIGHSMFLILTGCVQVLISDCSGNVNTVAFLRSGDVVGEMAILTKQPRNANVVADEETDVIELEGDDLYPLLREHPHLARFLTAVLDLRILEYGFLELGKYKIIERIGHGQTATVFSGIHPGLNRKVAIKMLYHSLALDELFVKRFVDEARIVAQFDHPNITKVHDSMDLFGTFFIVMEKVSGKDLKTLLKDKTRFHPSEVIEIMRQIVVAVRHAHEHGIIHRDIKPANCVMHEDGTIKIMDFGISRKIEDTEIQSNVLMGSPAYIAPELIRGAAGDERSDIYALGIMAYELISGKPPYKGETVRDILAGHLKKEPQDITEKVAGVQPGLAKFIHTALKKNPDDRETETAKLMSLLDRRGTYNKAEMQCKIPESLRIDGSEEALLEVEAMLDKFCKKKGISISCTREFSYRNRRAEDIASYTKI
ncbi:MAG: protein kinase [Magnetococcales bacterium]|nr:protein kinase [Magnetococcales bacterium]